MENTPRHVNRMFNVIRKRRGRKANAFRNHLNAGSNANAYVVFLAWRDKQIGKQTVPKYNKNNGRLNAFFRILDERRPRA